MALTFTDSNFEAEVLQSNKLKRYRFFGHHGVGPCLALGPSIEALSN
jgi:hypothetical protein